MSEKVLRVFSRWSALPGLLQLRCECGSVSHINIDNLCVSAGPIATL